MVVKTELVSFLYIYLVMTLSKFFQSRTFLGYISFNKKICYLIIVVLNHLMRRKYSKQVEHDFCFININGNKGDY